MSPEPKTIIVVEDEPDTAEMFAEMMRLSGYDVYKTYGGASAIKMIAEEKPDAVVLDLMMPGLDVLRFMRNNPGLDRIPVIIVSAKGLIADVREGLDAGAAVYLTKPVAFLDLKVAVDNAINDSKQETVE
jgi:DNA-binding response OmpR family regulator